MGAGRRSLQDPRKDSGRSWPGVAPWILLAWIAAAPLSGCGAPAGPEPTASSSSPIYGGVADADAMQNQGVVALRIDTNATTITLCSGALIAPNVVLTARHCVSDQTAMSVTCDQNGVSAAPPDFGADQPISTIHVFTGPVAALGGTPAANAAAVFHPTGTTLCNLDIALVVLATPITGITPLKIRLSGGATAGESTRTVGYGQNDQNAPLGSRFRKDDVAVLAIGSSVSASSTPLGSNEFEMGESMCEGDSGGPALDETTGAVVGIVSRGGACTDTTGHVYTTLAGFGSLFTQAFAMAGGAPVTENEPYPEAGAPVASPDAGSPGPTSSSSSGGMQPDPGNPDGPVNLRSGAGQGCSAGASPAPTGAALLLGVMLVFASARRRACSALYVRGHGRRTGSSVRSTHR